MFVAPLVKMTGKLPNSHYMVMTEWLQHGGTLHVMIRQPDELEKQQCASTMVIIERRNC